MKLGDLILKASAVFIISALVTDMVLDSFETVEANSGPRSIHKYYIEMVPDLDCIYIRTDYTGELGLSCNWEKFNRMHTLSKDITKYMPKEL